ncbi:MAG: hypothetical protein GY869_29705, partial [Planctomycetes bacterium]|nr:hypothetical protein [Planctomycetota bacterium]
SGSQAGCGVMSQFIEEYQNSDYMQVDYDHSAWPLIDLPTDNDLLEGEQTYWFRKVIDIPQSWSEYTQFALVLGQLDGASAAWFNGVFVGETEFIQNNRYYLVPDSLVNIGGNVITFQLGLLEGSAGFIGDADGMQFLSVPHQNDPIYISGDWFYQEGITLEVDETVR